MMPSCLFLESSFRPEAAAAPGRLLSLLEESKASPGCGAQVQRCDSASHVVLPFSSLQEVVAASP